MANVDLDESLVHCAISKIEICVVGMVCQTAALIRGGAGRPDPVLPVKVMKRYFSALRRSASRYRIYWNMRTCSACGTIRPDSQYACDCAAHTALANATPVFTMVSFVTTLSVEAVIVYWSSHQNNFDWGAIGAFFLVALLTLVGMIINLTTGYLAHRRGEAGGWWAGLIGIAFWIVTLLPTVYRFISD